MRWKYLILNLRLLKSKTPVPMPTDDYDRDLKKLDELGSEGWEMISASRNFSPDDFTYIFKRDKSKKAT
jgi:hypothetical protein